jgi:myo-inositol-1(or 4)-monophosphatase
MEKPEIEFVIELTQQTGELLKSYFASTDLFLDRKLDNSLVTEADIVADQFIFATIHEKYPDHSIVSEELNHKLSSKNIKGYTWIVDPLDGTTNFSMGMHYWGTLITLVYQNRVQLTSQYFPLIDELFSAQLGKGATLNGEPIHVESPNNKLHYTFFSCCSRTIRKYSVTLPYKMRIFGSAAYSMCSVAKGASRIAFEAKAKIWDIAGAWLLIQEAGGYINTPYHTPPFPLIPSIDYYDKDYAVLAAANFDWYQQAKQNINPI